MPNPIGCFRWKIISWWIFHKSDDLPFTALPYLIEKWIIEADENLLKCDRKLASAYKEDYTPEMEQFWHELDE